MLTIPSRDHKIVDIFRVNYEEKVGYKSPHPWTYSTNCYLNASNAISDTVRYNLTSPTQLSIYIKYFIFFSKINMKYLRAIVY